MKTESDVAGAGSDQSGTGDTRAPRRRTRGKNGGKNGGDSGAGGGRRATAQVRTYSPEDMLEALLQLESGNFAARLPENGDGLQVDIAQAFNRVAALNQGMTDELARVSRTVGREGESTDRAELPGAQGDWAQTVDSVNSLITDLMQPTQEIARTLGAVAQGDLTQKMSLEIEGKQVQGEFLRIATTVNTMVDQLSSFADEVTRVAREVGTEGQLGGQAEVANVAGTWKDLTDSVNSMASNLTAQVRNIALVTTAVANGDLSQKITVDVRGEVLELKDTINTMVDRLNEFAGEVTRVAREVGTEGKLGGQARVEGVAGVWRDLTESVNFMAGNLTDQVRNIADVTTAVARGDLTRKITAEAEGEILELKNTINTMVDQLGSFASEVTRVATEVGTEGQLGGQARVEGVEGTWRDLTNSVNALASNLTIQLRDVSSVATAIADGDLTRKITVQVSGEILQIKNVINSMVDRLSVFADEVTRVAREVGTEGVLGGQAEVPNVAGTWKDLTDSVNSMASNLTNQVRNIADVTTAVASGDLTRKITAEAQGEIRELKDTINTMVDQLGSFASEVTRVATEVGTEGQLGGQARVEGVAGTWRDLTNSVNALASNLTVQLRDVSSVATAIADGDLTRKITVEVSGEILQIKNVINSMVDRLSVFADEVTRVAREVGTEGVLGGQAAVPNVAGTWKDLTDSVNSMASNLTSQVRNIAVVTTAVANGDLSQKITVDVRGEVLELKNTINTMVDQLNAFAGEVTRVAKEVGTEGKLGGQARVEGVAGVWRDLTENVNAMASNLTVQLRDVSAVATAIADGDLRRQVTAEARGEILQIKDVINSMVDRLSVFADEVTRVAREVGTEGVLGGQARVPNVAGTWKDLTDSVNYMATNLTTQVRNIADVTTAVAQGDLSRKITAEAQGEILELKSTINTMVDQLSSFASEVTRVAREVGTEGVLGGQANVQGVAGTWKDLTDSVNSMAGNLTTQVRNIADVTTAVARGDLTQKITAEARGEILELKKTINTMVEQLSAFASEVTRVAREVGTEGRLGGQANVPGVGGTWKDLTDNVNFMASNLTAQVRNIADVTTAVARGDLSRKITVDVRGEVLELKDTINTMVDQLNGFASEVTRVAREVGTEGLLGAQANVPGVGGTWKDLTDNVNFMASNLTNQVRNIALVTTAVANGDLSQKITVDVRGEIFELKDTINNMVDSLRVFADEVTRVAKEVGTEGILGGQAEVPAAQGTWRALTDNVNQLANNLTVQVRAIGEVATAVTKGDLTRTITVDARGELDDLKVNLNRMIGNLRETTERNQEQDWLKTNLARFSRLMQGQRDLESVSNLIMSELSPLVQAQHGTFFIRDDNEGGVLRLIASYAYKERKNVSSRFHPGEGLVGQAALEKKPILLTNVPDDYVRIMSGLGEAAPRNVIVLPVVFEGEVKGVIELASFTPFSQINQILLDQLAESLGVVLNMIGANMRTEELLQQSQALTQELQTQSVELQSQQEELRRTNAELEAQARTLKASEEQLRDQQEELQQVNEELEEKASLLVEQNRNVEEKNREVERARLELEEKAEQLSLSSKYKSEFLANMSHELRTPLNSLLILAKELYTNGESNLTPKQVQYAETIYSSGADLLSLINDVLDLSKVEAGRMEIEPTGLLLAEVSDYVTRSFDPVAREKGLDFTVEVEPGTPESISTDPKRLQQILKNLIANALKFTERGAVGLRMKPGQLARYRNPELEHASAVVAFDVWDTGIGIEQDKQRLIFEAFQQADASTTRKFGGTGLGLSISREIARLLGGEIRVTSEPGTGSTFTLYLPVDYEPPESGQQVEQVMPFTQPHPIRGGRQRGGALEPAPNDNGPIPNPLGDDRDLIEASDRVVLIIENDATFAQILMDLARDKGFRALGALDGETGLRLLRTLQPDAVTLDLDLPGIDGWQVLDRIKRAPETRHIPVHIVSGTGQRHEGLSAGALAYLEKPVSKESLEQAFEQIGEFVARSVKSLLIVEDDETQRMSITELIGEDDVNITAVATAAEALKLLSENRYDCMVLDLGLRDMSGFTLLETIKTNDSLKDLPVIIYTGKDLTQAEETELRRYAETIIIKDARSPERLLDETSLFLHRVESRLPETKRRMLEQVHSEDTVFAGRKILIVDDDVRNIFALTALLENHAMQVVFAENGRAALDVLEQSPEVDMILMDVMMPEMDGYEATQAIRQMPQFAELPIIALTAKAMKGDRERSIASGASDYITKPVDSDQLLSLMRVWLYR
jgi:HAMP domain-containing protein/CheY-like chemotaxis protein